MDAVYSRSNRTVQGDSGCMELREGRLVGSTRTRAIHRVGLPLVIGRLDALVPETSSNHRDVRCMAVEMFDRPSRPRFRKHRVAGPLRFSENGYEGRLA